ncbi:hypothetical protein [Burkholderia cepacia]|nr:hypothetical protein [Burkholderia cepacia]
MIDHHITTEANAVDAGRAIHFIARVSAALACLALAALAVVKGGKHG